PLAVGSGQGPDREGRRRRGHRYLRRARRDPRRGRRRSERSGRRRRERRRVVGRQLHEQRAPGAERRAGCVGRRRRVPGPPAGGSGATTPKAQGLAAIPAYVATRSLSSGGIAIALIGIVLVTSLGASLSGKRNLAVAGGGAGSSASARVERSAGSLVALWCAVAIAGVGLVVYQLGPLLSSRDQRQLLSSYRTQVAQAPHEAEGLAGVSTPKKAPELGSPIGVLEVGAIRLQSVVVEGVSASETSQGPGHVPGTAGLGQPGNSVVVGRRNGYGGAVADLPTLRKGDP